MNSVLTKQCYEKQEKEFLTFTVPSNLTPEKIGLVAHIKQTAESLLYSWKEYSILLPSSSFTQDAAENVIDPNQLFIAPSFDELEEIAAEHPELTKEQLQSIKRRGEFDVPSKYFPGQFHKWRLGLFFGKGSERAYEALLCNCALALRLLMITAKGRISSRFFSLKSSLKSIANGLWQILDILFGMPLTRNTTNINSKLADEHKKYLVAELKINRADRKSFDELYNYVSSKYYGLNEVTECQERSIAVPHVFSHPRGQDLDLRLYNQECIKKAKSILTTILFNESKGWYIKYKEKVIYELQGQNLTTKQLSEKVEMAVRDEYFRRLFDAIENSKELDDIQHDLGKLLVRQAKAHLIVAKVNDVMKEKYYNHKQQREKELKKLYPVRCKIQPWMRDQLDKFKEEYLKRNRWLAHEKAVEECQRQGLQQMAYFIQRDLIFRRDREPALTKEIRTVNVPAETYTYFTRIWMPRNWIVTKLTSHKHVTQSEILPTVVHKELLPEAHNKFNNDYFNNGVTYSVCKKSTRTSDTQYFGWRCCNFVLRTWSWLFNSMYYLLIVIPLCSPISIRALIGCHVFYPRLVASPANGELYHSSSSKTHTMSTKLNRLWRNVRHSREKFEGKPDTGFLNKDMARPFHKFWNFVLKGSLGSLLFVLFYPPVCLISFLLCMFLASTAFIWAPIGSLLAYLISVFIYDFDHAGYGNRVLYILEAVFYRIIVLGLLQLIVTALTAFFLVPLASLSVLIFGIVRWLMRRMWDTFMFHLVVKRRGRVPASDTYVARRLSGPGVASNYFYQIRPEQALAAVQVHMETEALQLWSEVEKSHIKLPCQEFESFVKDCFSPFSAQLSECLKYRDLMNHQIEIEKKLLAAVAERKKLLGIPIDQSLCNKIRINNKDLMKILARTALMVENFYPDKVFALMSADKVQQYWEVKNLETGDWHGLAANILSNIFSSHFLTPLEDTDTCFQLQVDELTLSEYMKRLITVDFTDDLDPVTTVFSPKESIDVEKPQINLSSFFPTYDMTTTGCHIYIAELSKPRRPWKTKREDNEWHDSLCLPLPVPHPLHINILIHNRENDQNTVNLDDLLTGNSRFMMQSLENCDIAVPDQTVDTSCLSPDSTLLSRPDASGLSDSFLRHNDTVPLSPFIEPTTSNIQDEVFVDGEKVPDRPKVFVRVDDVDAQVIYSEGETNNSCVVSMSDDEEGMQLNSWRLSAHTNVDV